MEKTLNFWEEFNIKCNNCYSCKNVEWSKRNPNVQLSKKKTFGEIVNLKCEESTSFELRQQVKNWCTKNGEKWI